ncbi:hypothetical protein ABZ642_44780 [Streptomyces sp. NPDC007157]|uniref:hypothetical protein n=1 Tax=Streptomyces sp. NPDC007157 TaxID=3154681 RepID=UPI0033E55137
MFDEGSDLGLGSVHGLLTCRKCLPSAAVRGDARALIAVSAASNRSKADKDPTEWLPPYAGYWCTYVTDRVADKTRYQLSIDPAWQTALTEQPAACPDQPIIVTLTH